MAQLARKCGSLKITEIMLGSITSELLWISYGFWNTYLCIHTATAQRRSAPLFWQSFHTVYLGLLILPTECLLSDSPGAYWNILNLVLSQKNLEFDFEKSVKNIKDIWSWSKSDHRSLQNSHSSNQSDKRLQKQIQKAISCRKNLALQNRGLSFLK
jgi:hypothetical protein